MQDRPSGVKFQDECLLHVVRDTPVIIRIWPTPPLSPCSGGPGGTPGGTAPGFSPALHSERALGAQPPSVKCLPLPAKIIKASGHRCSCGQPSGPMSGHSAVMSSQSTPCSQVNMPPAPSQHSARTARCCLQFCPVLIYCVLPRGIARVEVTHL